MSIKKDRIKCDLCRPEQNKGQGAQAQGTEQKRAGKCLWFRKTKKKLRQG
jgi:hypothetical protein